MATDAAFLAEVDDFLVAFDLPAFPTARLLASDEDSDEVSSMDAESPSKPQDASKPLEYTAGSRGAKKQPLTSAEVASKLERERAKDRKRHSAYRERQRVEKETLQQQVGDLSTELTALNKAKDTKKPLSSSAWKIMARHQLQARLNAEEKQRRLIQAVEARANLIEEFKGFLHDRLNVVGNVGETVYKPKRIRLEPSDTEFYKAFVDELDDVYSQADDMLRVCGLDSTEVSWDRPRRQWKEEGENGYYVYTDMHVMPFDFEQICEYAWQVAQLAHRQEDREHYDGMQNPENTSAFKFRVTTRLSSSRSVSVLQRTLVRRYVKDGRCVVIWRSFTEGEGIFSGMHADECGWCICTPLPSSPTSMTLLRTMMRYIPMHFSAKTLQEPDAKQFTGFVLDTGTENAIEIASSLERLLLRDK